MQCNNLRERSRSRPPMPPSRVRAVATLAAAAQPNMARTPWPAGSSTPVLQLGARGGHIADLHLLLAGRRIAHHRRSASQAADPWQATRDGGCAARVYRPSAPARGRWSHRCVRTSNLMGSADGPSFTIHCIRALSGLRLRVAGCVLGLAH
ncbi:hypothetical protein SEVIR_3G133750v4 [Setaria viridis]